MNLSEIHPESARYASAQIDGKGLDSELITSIASLLEHPIYPKLESLENLRIFMESHVFAVWDFMSLLKSLQARITCVQIPWFPNPDPSSVRFINEIVLAEESDEIAPGVFFSHYELYLQAMEEIGADTRSIRDFVAKISDGLPLDDSLLSVEIPESTKNFVRNSLAMAKCPVHVSAAVFFYGREDLIPRIFQKILESVENQLGYSCKYFRHYLNRHIEIDQESHGPLAKKLIENLCGENPDKWEESLLAAKSAIRARQELWDGILLRINLN